MEQDFLEDRFMEAYQLFGVPVSNIFLAEGNKLPARWLGEKAAKSTGDVTFLLKGWNADRPRDTAPGTIVEIDASRGYIITHLQCFFDNGLVGRDEVITPRQDSASGQWYPGAIKESLFAYANSAIAPRTTEITFDNVNFNPAINPEMFEISALRLDTDVTVFATSAEGDTKPLPKSSGQK